MMSLKNGFLRCVKQILFVVHASCLERLDDQRTEYSLTCHGKDFEHKIIYRSLNSCKIYNKFTFVCLRTYVIQTELSSISS